MKIDLKRLYYGVTAFLVFLVLFISAETFFDQVADLSYYGTFPPAQRVEQTLAPQPPEVQQEDFQLRSAKEQVAGTLATILVALPIWWFHWKRWRAVAEKDAPTAFKLSVYALMIITLITAMARAAGVLGKLFEFGLGLTPITDSASAFSLTKDLASGIIGALIALAAWGYHSRVAGQTETIR
jgi:hypothetical protein